MQVREAAVSSALTGGRQVKLAGRRILLALAGISAVALALTLLLPVTLGGSASYVVTDGTSMLPHFKANGLVVTRVESSYHVGEVVAYHNHQLKRVVMHRIIAIDGDRYVFKGDNNNFADQYHPAKADIVGKEWVYWAGGGRYFNMLRNPLTFAVVIGLIALLAFRTPNRSRRRRRHHG